MSKINEISLQPARFLVENIELLPKGRVFDVAMGSGRNSVYLAKMGFKVEGIDILPEAVSSALELSRKSGVNLRARVADLEGDYHIEKGAYDVIICFNYLYLTLGPTVTDMEAFEGDIVSDVMEGGFTTEEFLEKNTGSMKTVPDVLNMAMMLETQAMDLYMRYSDKAKDEKSKTVLHNIAEEEKIHLKALGNLMEERA